MNFKFKMPEPKPPIDVEFLYGMIKYHTSVDKYEAYKVWRDSLDMSVYSGVNGGRFTYEITPTSIGTIFIVKDSITKTEFDLTEYNYF